MMGSEGYAQTLTYDTATGAQHWTAKYDSDRRDVGTDAALSLDGSTLHIAVNDEYDLVAVAYDTAGGAERGVRRHNSSVVRGDWNLTTGVSVSPHGVHLGGTFEYGRALGPEPLLRGNYYDIAVATYPP